jgi:hypothetical protein
MFSQPQKTQAARKKINVRSFDFDGCLFNMNYIESKDSNRFILHNENFIKTMTAELNQEKFDDIIFFIGSNRQSYNADKTNSITFQRGAIVKGSCFYRLKELRDEINKRGNLQCRIDPYLLADTYGNRKPGESFDLALKHLPKPKDESVLAYYDSVTKQDEKQTSPHADWVFDHSKFTVLYAQLHKTALENPEADISYDFYDDRHDILNPLAEVFRTNPDLFPKNITLNLHHYSGEQITKLASIQGVGTPDASYGDHIKAIADMHQTDTGSERQMSPLSVFKSKPALNIPLFKKYRQMTPSELNTELKQETTTTPTLSISFFTKLNAAASKPKSSLTNEFNLKVVTEIEKSPSSKGNIPNMQ